MNDNKAQLIQRLARIIQRLGPARLAVLRRRAERSARACPTCPIADPKRANTLCHHCLSPSGSPPQATIN